MGIAIFDPPSTAAVTAAEVVRFKNVRRVMFFSFWLKVPPKVPLPDLKHLCCDDQQYQARDSLSRNVLIYKETFLNFTDLFDKLSWLFHTRAACWVGS